MAGPEQDATLAIEGAEKIIQKAAKDIPLQNQFYPDINQQISTADNNLFMAKNDYDNKRYNEAVINANTAKALIEQALTINAGLIEQMEQQILIRVNSLKNKFNNESINNLIFEAENYFQQKNYFECIKLIEVIQGFQARKTTVVQNKEALKKIITGSKLTEIQIVEIIRDTKINVTGIRQAGFKNWLKSNWLFFILSIIGAGKVLTLVTRSKKDDKFYGKYIVGPAKSIARFFLFKR
jgi:hypothetical protein